MGIQAVMSTLFFRITIKELKEMHICSPKIVKSNSKKQVFIMFFYGKVIRGKMDNG
jgi:hypothetical protein